MSAYHIVVSVANGNFSVAFEIIDELDRGLDAFLHAFGQRNAAVAHHQRHSIDAVVKPNQRVIPFAAEQVNRGCCMVTSSPWKNHAFLPSGKDHLIDDFKIPGFKPHELTKHFIVVSGDVKHLLLASNHLKEFAYNLHVLGRKYFLELPNVNDVAVQDEHLRINGVLVLQNFERPASGMPSEGEMTATSTGRLG